MRLASFIAQLAAVILTVVALDSNLTNLLDTVEPGSHAGIFTISLTATATTVVSVAATLAYLAVATFAYLRMSWGAVTGFTLGVSVMMAFFGNLLPTALQYGVGAGVVAGIVAEVAITLTERRQKAQDENVSADVPTEDVAQGS